jgi:hypothetical protein
MAGSAHSSTQHTPWVLNVLKANRSNLTCPPKQKFLILTSSLCADSAAGGRVVMQQQLLLTGLMLSCYCL